MLEDYDRMVNLIKQNFPFYALVQRRYGIDVDSYLAEGRTGVSACENNKAFGDLLQRTLDGLHYVGHISLVHPVQFGEYMLVPLYAADNPIMDFETPYFKDVGQTFLSALPKYRQWMKVYEIGNYKRMAHAASSNIETRIIDPDKIAYIQIKSFFEVLAAPQIEAIRDFFQSVQHYEHVIIDITGNGGGHPFFWSDIILPATPDGKTYTFRQYSLFRDSNLTRRQLGMIMPLAPFKKVGLDELRAIMPRLGAEAESLPIALEEEHTFTYRESTFSGKRWLLVDDQVFSAAEFFTAFCLSSGWATVVGTQTAGDGIWVGAQSGWVPLENSGLIVRLPIAYGLNPDGTCNQEVGSTPDILSPERETPLETCLKAIAKLREPR